MLLLAALPLFSACPARGPGQFSRGVLIRFEGVVLPDLEAYVERQLEAADKEGADLVILEIESPGGLLKESLDIANRLKAVARARTVAYVPDRAISGAAIIALGCDEIVMAPTARIGDAGVILLEENLAFKNAPEKVITDTAAQLRLLAQAKGHPPALAEAFVIKNMKLRHVKNRQTGEVTCIAEAEYKSHRDQWDDLGVVPITSDDRYLELLGSEAVKFGLARTTAANRTELAELYGLANLHVVGPGSLDRAVEILNSIWITGLLLAIGLIGLYVEFTMPGTGIGGLVAAACFAVIFWSHFLGGTAGWLQVVLFLLGVAFVAVELFFLPGTMVAGLVGVCLILVSLVMVVQGFLIPHSPQQVSMLVTTLAMICVSCLVLVGAAVVIGRKFGSLPIFSHLMLPPPEPGNPRGKKGQIEGRVEPFAPPPVTVGELGIAHSPLRPAGKARFGDRLVDVLTDGDFLVRGTRVRVLRIVGNQVFVEQAEENKG
jgi:membrane-bound serine protease (ClpP class)